ncbi:MAG: alginate lyase family protein [Candidatus Zixiibacteriota bacterium]
MPKSRLKKVLTQPPHKSIKKIYSKIEKIQSRKKQEKFDLSHSTRTDHEIPIISISLIEIGRLNLSNYDDRLINYLTKMYLEHRFDLLGSGWVQNSYSSRALGLDDNRYDMNINIELFDPGGHWLEKILLPTHLNDSRAIWKMITGEYIPIDWQKDFKSGYRFNQKEWYIHQFVQQPGVDIKVPWELARMQHLPQLALFGYRLIESREKIANEIRNQLLDFIATNPPRMGVNWTCPMDVAIRAINMLVAYDLAGQLDDGTIFDESFRQVFTKSIYEHGLHILDNLEWSEELTNNHYLSDITGLLFMAVYLDRTEEADRWLAFATQEIITEFKKQFYDDGGNFESSTAYHCLSLEMIIFATALILGLDESKRTALAEYDYSQWTRMPRLKSRDERCCDVNAELILPDIYLDKLARAGQFLKDILKPTGDIPQIGDNDSGRLFKLRPEGEFLSAREAQKKYINLRNYTHNDDDYWDESILKKEPLLFLYSALFDTNEMSQLDTFEKSLINILTRGKKLPRNSSGYKTYNLDLDINAGKNLNLEQIKEQMVYQENKQERPLNQNGKWIIYPDSGIFIYHSDRAYMIVSGTPNGQKGLGGHGHNDKLSFELNIDGNDIIVDPGTYLYTPLPEYRNRFRSAKCHSTTVINNEEQNRWDEGWDGLFAMSNETIVKLLDLSGDRISLSVRYRDKIHIRDIIIGPLEIMIKDSSNFEFDFSPNQNRFYSNGYGKLIDLKSATNNNS